MQVLCYTGFMAEKHVAIQRDHLIDSLRGIAIIAMILTHTTYFFISDKTAMQVWNWSNFAVPIFIFCSAYLFLQKNLDKPISGFAYLKKRLLRLIIPYYIFLLFFIPILFFLKPETASIRYVLQSILIIGGVDINWLVLLFIYFSLILPFFVLMFQKAKIFFWVTFVITLLSAFWFLFFSSPVPYKYVMWIPWSLILYFTLLYLRYEKKSKKLFLIFVLSLAVFLISYYTRVFMEQSVVLTHNKYPPNMLYLSYGTTSLVFLSLILKRFTKKNIFSSILHYFSLYSYPLYFIHYIILTLFVALLPYFAFNWLTFFIVVLCTTVVVQKVLFGINYKSLISSLRGTKQSL